MSFEEFRVPSTQETFIVSMASAGGVDTGAVKIVDFNVVRRRSISPAARRATGTSLSSTSRRLLQQSINVQSLISYNTQAALTAGVAGVQANAISNLQAAGFSPDNASMTAGQLIQAVATTPKPQEPETTEAPESNDRELVIIASTTSVGGLLALLCCIGLVLHFWWARRVRRGKADMRSRLSGRAISEEERKLVVECDDPRPSAPPMMAAIESVRTGTNKMPGQSFPFPANQTPALLAFNGWCASA